MKEIESFKGKWRIARESSFIRNDHSRTQQSFMLPERFTPSKGGLNDSLFINSSIQKSKPSTISPSKEQSLNPRTESIINMLVANTSGLPHSILVQRQTPQKREVKSKLSIITKDSLSETTEAQVEAIKRKIMKDLMGEYEGNRKIILELKKEFDAFRESVSSELISQQATIHLMVDEIIQKVNVRNPEAEKQLYKMTEKQDSFVEAISHKINNFDKVQTVHLEQIEKAETRKPETETKQKQEIKVEEEEEVQVKTPCKQVQVVHPNKDSPLTERSSPDFQKYNQIFETINILTEINDAPVQISSSNRPKSLEKKAIQDYKQKILAISKSKDYLYKPPMKLNSPSELKSKGSNFKLDRFYNAIEKLKEDVNQIRHISDLKQTKGKGVTRIT